MPFALTFYRILKSGWNNFLRNSWLALATISVMVLAIFFMNSLIFVNLIGATLLVNLQTKVDISVYLKQDASEQDVSMIRSDLTFLNEVKDVNYISADEALASFKAKHQGNAVLMESLQELGNPLLPVLNVEAQKASQYEAIVNFLEQDKYKTIVDKINYQQTKPLIDRLSSFTHKVSRGGLIISIILAFVAGLVTFNTIRLAMYNFRHEVSVMRLVGASNWYIRGPFLVEGVIYGVIAAASTTFLLFVSLYFLSPKMNSLVPGSDLLGWFKANFLELLFFQAGVGILLGGVGSLVAIRKYLKV
ncbi:MAG: ABC transporter permease [Candidatus Portnoybacteria bacterium]|nr:ABC transporter permease [Candidatus Portnoybacteria bacterium]